MSKLKEARLLAELNINQAAEKAGISVSFLHQIENGERAVDAEKALILAKVYNVDVSEIFVVKRYKSK